MRVTNGDGERTPEVGFSAKSAYLQVIKLYRPTVVLNPSIQFAFNNIWKSAAPSKVIAFSWQLMLDRIPTRENLVYRGLPRMDDLVCPLCNGGAETDVHLFLHCPVAGKLWYEIVWWIDQSLVLPANLSQSLVLLAGCGISKQGKKGMLLIWHAFVWVIWRTRNNRIFNNGVVDSGEMMELVMRLSWEWFIERMTKSPCMFYEWRWNPADCFSR